MCGIAGVWGNSIVPAETLRLVEIMNRSQVHRGPDDEGTFAEASSFGSVALGNRRLAIQDLSRAGHQPMVDPTTGIAVTMNGEIYNFREIAANLSSHGHVFSSVSDTEV